MLNLTILNNFNSLHFNDIKLYVLGMEKNSDGNFSVCMREWKLRGNFDDCLLIITIK